MLIASTVLGLAAAAAGQGVSEGWYGLESFSGSGSDQGVEIAEWKDEEDQFWIYVAGYVTEGSYTRLAVWRYKADEPAGLQAAQAVAYFPDPTFYPTISGHTKATGIIIDPFTGNVYVCGSTQISTQTSSWPVFGSDYNYVILKYNPDLTVETSAQLGAWLSPGGSAPAGFRLYDGAGLDDKAVDITVDNDSMTSGGPFVYVTGSSEDSTTGADIVTLKLRSTDGEYSNSWPSPVGIRRFRGFGGDRDDIPVGLGWILVVEKEGVENGIWVYVAGTSHNGDDHDIVALGYDPNASVGSSPGEAWWDAFDGGSDDVAAALAWYYPMDSNGNMSLVVVTGYAAAGGATDFVTIAWGTLGEHRWEHGSQPMHRTWSGPGDSIDAAWSAGEGYGIVWVAGNTRDQGVYHPAAVAYWLSTGDELCTHIDPGQAAGGRNARSVVARNGETVAYVTGELVGTVAYTYELLYDGVHSDCVQEWTMTYPASAPSDTPNAGVKVFIGENGVFITGWSNQGSTGMDALTVRYVNP